MVVREKIFVPEKVYFITFTIYNWTSVFTEEKYYQLIYKWFDYQKQNYNNKIHGYVIMPNHFHGLIYITEKSPVISKLIQNAKRFLAYEIVKLLKEDKKQIILDIFSEKARRDKGAYHKVFKDRYDSKIIDNEDLFQQKINYIHYNPCKDPWSFCEYPEEYLHSSASNYILGKGVYEVEVTG